MFMGDSKAQKEARIKDGLKGEAERLCCELDAGNITPEVAKSQFDQFRNGVYAGVQAMHGKKGDKPEVAPEGEFHAIMKIRVVYTTGALPVAERI